jgi:hypothetical protein
MGLTSRPDTRREGVKVPTIAVVALLAANDIAICVLASPLQALAAAVCTSAIAAVVARLLSART